jgi:diacylglycerol kinase
MIGALGANYIVQSLKYASTAISNLAAPEAALLSFVFLCGVLFVFAAPNSLIA